MWTGNSWKEKKEGRHKRHTTAVWFDTRTHTERERPISERKKVTTKMCDAICGFCLSRISRKNTQQQQNSNFFFLSLVSLFILRNAVYDHSGITYQTPLLIFCTVEMAVGLEL